MNPIAPIAVAFCQVDIAWEAVAQNLAHLEGLVASVEADVVVLPEMFATGFLLQPEWAAEPMQGEIVGALRCWAARYGKALVGTVAVNDGGIFRNRMLFVEPSGRMSSYDKRHLFRPGGEGAAYCAGNERVVVSYRGWRFLLAACYDLRFPVWLRNRGDYDVLLCAASWPASRREVWRTLLRARAIENQCYVVGVNRVGEDSSARYAGDSALLDFCGRTLVEGGAAEQVAAATFDHAALDDFRRKFPVWQDADNFGLLP